MNGTIKMIGCKCSEMQLYHVGCECELFTVEVWPRGYADDSGLKRFTAATNDRGKVGAEARRLFGIGAAVYYVRPHYVPPVCNPMTDAQAREYTRNDNS